MKKKQQLAVIYLVNCIVCLFMFISLIFTKHTEVALFASAILGTTVIVKLFGKSDISAADLKRERVLTEVNPTEVLGSKIHAAWDKFIFWLNN